MATGSSFTTSVRTVYVHKGPRGPQGFPGDTGATGAQGDSINVRGLWVTGTVYSPLDAVTYRSRLLDGVNSLYIQKSTSPAAASTTPPNLDTARWEEVGAVQFGNAFGGIWEVYQAAHGFTAIGTPVAFDFGTGVYIPANAGNLAQLGVAVVREVVDVDRVVLQSTGEVPFINDAVIWPNGSSWVPGTIYYVSTVTGRLEPNAPTAMGSYSNPILMPTDSPSPGSRNGVALPWSPQAAPATPNAVIVGVNKFRYNGVVTDDTFTGADRDANVLAYTAGDSTSVFVAGVLQDPNDYTAADGTTVVLGTPLAGSATVEIWAAEDISPIVVASTVSKLDDIESQFNGSDTTFSLTVGAVDIALTDDTNFLITLDVALQESGTDFTIIDDPLNAGFCAIQFSTAPPASTRFFGYLYEPSAP